MTKDEIDQAIELMVQRLTDTICLHAQQCVEKYLKAMLVLRGSSLDVSMTLARLWGFCQKTCNPI